MSTEANQKLSKALRRSKIAFMSHIWNGQESAFRFAAICMLGLLFLAQHE